MERTEPALFPEWLRSTGSVTGGSTSVHHSDISSSAHSVRSRSFRSNNGKDRPLHANRSPSPNFRRSSSSNGLEKHPYSSFSRNNRDRNHDREKEKSFTVDIWDHDSSDPLGSILTSRVDRSALRRSQSLVSRQSGESLPRRVENSRASGNGVLSRGSNLTSNQKSVFENDFPSLGTEEKQVVTGIRRPLSPGLSSVIESLPIGNSGFLGGEKWTSALAEVPDIRPNNGMGHSPLRQNVVTYSNSSVGVSSASGLNMAEALSQPAPRVHVNSQKLDKSQRLEELAIKQSRQLIPMTPSMPKPLVPSSVDKPKQPKVAVRTNEMTVASRGVHVQPTSSQLSNQSRSGQIKSDSVSTPHVGKFLVLKPGRESVASVAKDASSPTDDANSQLMMAPSTPTSPMSLNNSMVSAIANKTAALSLTSRSIGDKRSPKSLAQSRSEFFNLMRRKATADSSLSVSSPTAEFKEGHAVENPFALENSDRVTCNGEKSRSSSDVKDDSLSCNGYIYPDEEEAAFLRSLGWEENGEEDEGLTEEEINAFYQEYMNRRPPSEACRNSQSECSRPSKLPNAISDTACSDSSSSESEFDS